MKLLMISILVLPERVAILSNRRLLEDESSTCKHSDPNPIRFLLTRNVEW